MNDTDQKLSPEETIELSFLESLLVRCPDDLEILKALGDLYTRSGQLKEGRDVDLRVVAAEQDNATAWYNLACSYSLLGDIDKAFDSLARARTLGFSDIGWMREDPDLDPIRQDRRFEALLTT